MVLAYALDWRQHVDLFRTKSHSLTARVSSSTKTLLGFRSWWSHTRTPAKPYVTRAEISQHDNSWVATYTMCDAELMHLCERGQYSLCNCDAGSLVGRGRGKLASQRARQNVRQR